MPEATVLYLVTAVVVLGLVLWVAVVLKTAKEPWARAIAPQLAEPLPVEGPESGKDSGTIDADATSKATPVALANDARAKTPSTSDDAPEAKDGGAEV